MRMQSRLLPLAAAFFAIGAIDVQAITPATVAVGVYDDTALQANNVNFNAVGNVHSASTGDGGGHSTIGPFQSIIAGAFADGRGGVATFDDLAAGTSSNGYTVSFAGGTKQFNLIFNGAGIISTGGGEADSTAISGANYLEPHSTASFTITFGAIVGGAPGETGFSEIGLTLLSADIEGKPGQPFHFDSVSVVAHFSDNSTATLSRIINEGNGMGDSFFNIVAPNNLTITSIDINDFIVDQVPDIDDIAFITNAVVPEPGTISLVCLPLIYLFGRRILCRRR